MKLVSIPGPNFRPSSAGMKMIRISPYVCGIDSI